MVAIDIRDRVMALRATCLVKTPTSVAFLVMPRQHVADGGANAGVGDDVELERLCGWRASEVSDQADVVPSLK